MTFNREHQEHSVAVLDRGVWVFSYTRGECLKASEVQVALHVGGGFRSNVSGLSA
jgi:hypothetical protein